MQLDYFHIWLLFDCYMSPKSVTFCIGGTNGKAMVAHSIKTTNWQPLYDLQTCEGQVTYFYNSMTEVLDEHMPLRTIKKHREDKPWITEGMKCAISYRQAAHKSGNKTRFKYWRNHVNRMNKKLRSKNHQNRSLQNTGDNLTMGCDLLGQQAAKSKTWWYHIAMAPLKWIHSRGIMGWTQALCRHAHQHGAWSAYTQIYGWHHHYREYSSIHKLDHNSNAKVVKYIELDMRS